MGLAEQGPAEDLFTQYRSIVLMYVSTGSELEINIGTAAMRHSDLEVQMSPPLRKQALKEIHAETIQNERTWQQ